MEGRLDGFDTRMEGIDCQMEDLMELSFFHLFISFFLSFFLSFFTHRKHEEINKTKI
jgi:hypothetical protein